MTRIRDFNLPDSFKETEIGPIPVDWDVMQLGKACQLGRENVDPQEWPEMLYVGLEHIESGEPKLRRWGDSSEVKSSKKHFCPGDVLYGKLRPYLDKAVLAEIEGICSTDILVLKADPDHTVAEFLVHSLHTQRFLSYAVSTTSGTNLPRTRWISLKEFELALPPLPEQRRIAHVLSTIQRAIAAQDDLIAAAREVKRSLMQRLFTCGPGPEPAPTKETEIGEIPDHWEVKQLQEAAEIVYGVQAAVASNLDPSIGIPILTNVNISADGMLDFTKMRYYNLPDKKREKLVLQRGDILFNWRSGSVHHVGKTAFFDLPGEYTFSSFLLRIRAHPEINNHFLFYYLTWLRAVGYFVRRCLFLVNAKFNASEAARTPTVIPLLEEQNEIAQALINADRKIATEEQRKAALQALFKAMLHQLMTGQIRMNAGADSHCMPL